MAHPQVISSVVERFPKHKHDTYTHIYRYAYIPIHAYMYFDSIIKHIFIHAACIHMQTNIPYFHICVPHLDLIAIGERHQLVFGVGYVSEHVVYMARLNTRPKSRPSNHALITCVDMWAKWYDTWKLGDSLAYLAFWVFRIFFITFITCPCFIFNHCTTGMHFKFVNRIRSNSLVCVAAFDTFGTAAAYLVLTWWAHDDGEGKKVKSNESKTELNYTYKCY